MIIKRSLKPVFRVERGFLEFMYKNVKYPATSRQNCEMGQAFVELEIKANGELGEVVLLNKISKFLDAEILRVVNETKGNWLAGDKDDRIEFSFGFEMGSANEIKGDLKITAAQISGPARSCGSMMDFEKKLKDALEKKKYKKAKRYCEELLRRAPREQLYKDAYQVIMQNLG